MAYIFHRIAPLILAYAIANKHQNIAQVTLYLHLEFNFLSPNYVFEFFSINSARSKKITDTVKVLQIWPNDIRLMRCFILEYMQFAQDKNYRKQDNIIQIFDDNRKVRMNFFQH